MDHDIREPIFDLHSIFQRNDDHVFKTECAGGGCCTRGSECRRVAVLYQGQGTHDGVQYRPQCDDVGFNAGDIGYVRRNLGHYVENVGDTDLQFIGVFKDSRYERFPCQTG